MSISIFDSYKTRFEEQKSVEMTLIDYLEECKLNRKYYATAFERILSAIGQPVIVDTSKDERLSRIHLNRKILTYPAFSDFYGIEKAIENVVAYFKSAAQGNEESRQVLYLLGPVGGGKSSIGTRLKELMEKEPVYTLRAFNKKRNVWEDSPITESPLGLFGKKEDAKYISETYQIDPRYMEKIIASPWAVKRLNEANGDLTQFKVVKVFPSIMNQKCISKVEPGDENNQDISSLVGKVNVKELRDYNQNDPDAYNWAGGLNVSAQGLIEFVEMFKAPIKMLHPLIEATQSRHYNGTEQFGSIPFGGVILAHSNETEWKSFRNNATNEAFLDRVCIVKVPYSLITTDETKIYKKMFAATELKNAPVAPGTYEMLSDFSILTRLTPVENSTLYAKLQIYDGQDLKDKDPKAKSVEEYRDAAGVNEGMTGSSTRFAFKIMSKVFNYDAEEISASPITLMMVLQNQIEQEQFGEETEKRYLNFIKEILIPRYADKLQEELQKAFLESYHDLGQNIFDQYIVYADNWIEHKDFRDPHTGNLFNRDVLDKELEVIEKAAGISNTKDFRHEVVNHVLRYKANHGKNPDWTSYEKMRSVIEKKMFANTEELLPVISYSKKSTSEEDKKHHGFVERMVKLGYTEKMVRIAVEWYIRHSKNK